MPADASIYGLIQQPKAPNPLADMAQVMQIQGAMGQNAVHDYTLRKAARDDSDTNALSSLYKTAVRPDGTIDRSALYSGAAQQGLGAKIPALQKSFAETDEADAKLQTQKMAMVKQRTELTGQAAGWLRANPTPENAVAMLDHLTQNQIIPPEMAAQMKQQVAANPGSVSQLADMMYRTALATDKQIATYQTRNTGGTTDTVQIDPVSGKTAVVGSVKNTQSPDSIAQNATSRANNAATIAGENMRAGVSADGSVSPDVEAQAQAIAKGQLMPPSGAALINPKNAKVLARVMEINPNYDATTVLAKKKAASDFTTGNLGNSMRSFAVAGQHLDQLGQLVDALDNGNMQLVNKVGNLYSQQTGSPAVTNFDAAKDVVSKEVVKAIVAGGGGVAEREELSKLMDNAKSPAQLKGVIKQYRNLMAAQHDALLAQRRAAGLTDSTLPNYTDANGSDNGGAVPSDIAAILQKHGSK